MALTGFSEGGVSKWLIVLKKQQLFLEMAINITQLLKKQLGLTHNT